MKALLERSWKMILKKLLIPSLADCKASGRKPEKPIKGSFNVRIPPKLHQEAALLAMEEKISLNNFVTEAIRPRIMKEVI
jgi:predicted HicB family RNase H-like nuclease